MENFRQFRILVFASAFACLMFELIVSRVADFHLGFRNSYLAIPITFLGLALGSLHVHFRKNIILQFDLKRAVLLLASVCIVTIFVIYLLFTSLFSVVAADADNQYIAYLLIKTLIFAVIFIIPFYFFGRILTVCYHLNRDKIGRIYSADFFGAALGCFLTPMLFHFISLPEVISVLMGVIFLMVLVFYHHSWPRSVSMAVVFLLMTVLMHFAIAKMEGSIHYKYYSLIADPPVTREITSRWNEFSRVQLVKFEFTNKARDHYKIIHDNARSNVHVLPYVPQKVKKPKFLDAMELPFLLERDVQDILVMFAGSGAEMVEFNEYSGGKANITGVEINALCKTIAANTPELAPYRLKEFYELPHIDLRVEEGRSFLMRNEKKYDVIYIGSSAPLSIAMTGHTRKFLYTIEAFRLYLDALKPGGVILFDHQPIAQNINTLKRIFEESGRKNFANSILLMASQQGQYRSGGTDLAFAPDGFTREEIARLVQFSPKVRGQLKYAPFVQGIEARWAKTIKNPIPPDIPAVTDDRPYILEVDFGNYTLWPTEAQFRDQRYYLSWIKITTLIAICAISVIFILIANLSKARRIPPAILVYLLMTGFCYLLVEIAYIAKLELFLQNPLVSMACVISIFLLTSGLGSLTYQHVALRLGMRIFPFLVAALVGGSIFLLDFLLQNMTGLPLGLKLILSAVAISPIGIALGMFYPYAVNCLVRHERENAIPITYGISTLSSVIGATYAMTIMIQTGFNHLLMQGVIGYALLGVFVLIYSLLMRRNLLA